MRLSSDFIRFALILLVPHIHLALTSDSLFMSPTGRFSVKFKQLQHMTSPVPGDECLIKYRVVFTDSRSRKSSSADFNDVYSVSNNGKPTPLARLFAQITWSPSDDFAVLPAEKWGGYPSPLDHIVLNLNRSFKWSTSSIDINDLVWFDSLTVVGTEYDDCHISVLCFDGRTGKTLTIKEGNTPIGYKVVGVKDDHLVIETLLDNCSNEQEKIFKTQQILIKLSDFRQTYFRPPQ